MIFKNKFQLTISSSDHSNINYLFHYFLYIITQNKISDLKIQQIQLPTTIKKFTILKSPHIYKTARTQLELRTLKKTIIFTNFNSIKKINIFKKILNYIIIYIPVLIKLNIKNLKLMFV